MKKFMTFALTVAVAALTMISCDKNDGNGGAQGYYSFATIDNPDESHFFYFTSDLDNTMYVTETRFPYYRPETDQRAILQYTILTNEDEESEYKHKVSLYGYYDILTKDIETITAENDDKFGNDPIYLREEFLWISNDYLNIEFEFLASNYGIAHKISLGINEEETYDDGKTHLEFRHNANNDSAYHTSWGMASFDLTSLQAEGVDSPLTLVIHTTPYNQNAPKEYELKYTFGEVDNSQRSYSLDNAVVVE